MATTRFIPLATCWLLLQIILVVVVNLTSSVSNGEVVTWRWPGVSGRWTNPTNWVSESGQYRLPGPGDDVVIGGRWGHPYNTQFQVLLQSNDPVRIKSLLVTGPSIGPPSVCSGYFEFWYYDNTAWTLFHQDWSPVPIPPVIGTPDKLSAWLIIFGPTELIVEQDVEIQETCLLHLVGNSEDSRALTTVRASNIDVEGVIGGSGNFYVQGGLSVPGIMQVLYLRYSSGVVSMISSTPSMGEWNVYGDLNISSSPFVYGHLDLPSISDLVIFTNQFDSTSLNLATLSFFTFDTANIAASSISNVYDSQTNPGFDIRQPPRNLCPASGVEPLPTTCNSNSAHSLSILIGGDATTDNCCSNPGYSGVDCNQPYCPGTPDCNGRGNCVAANPPFCNCSQGWTGYACEIPDCPGNPDCGQHGVCISHDVATPYCECDQGWESQADCSLPHCPGNCTSDKHGVCETAGAVPTCVCLPGFQLGPKKDCSVPGGICPGRIQPCSGHGSCNVTNGQCTCSSSWQGSDCSLPICTDACSQHGSCIDDGLEVTKCNCSQGWTGTTCSIARCPTNNVSLECSGHGHCSSDLDPPRCICDAPLTLLSAQPSDALSNHFGWTGSDCGTSRSPYCPSVAGYCSHGASCGASKEGFTCLLTSCASGYGDWDCSKYWCDSKAGSECSGHGACSLIGGTDIGCTCRQGYALGNNSDCRYAECEVNGCSEHGKCRTDLAVPTCECDPYFYGSDCSIRECPGDPKCSGPDNGQCVNGSCVCGDFWVGIDCRVPKCPGYDQDLINCDGHGSCNAGSTGSPSCECDQGWTGSSCKIGVCLNNCTSEDNGFCDTSHNPPVCSCNEGWDGDDCSEPESGGDGGDDDKLIAIIIPLIVGPMIIAVAFVLLGIAGAFVFFKWRHMRASAAMEEMVNFKPGNSHIERI